MNNKKILISFLLVVLMAISLSAVSAAEDVDEVASDDILAADDSVEVLSEVQQPTNNTVDAIDTAINNANEGDTVDLSNHAEYDFGNKTITISKDNLLIKGNGTTVIKGHGDSGKNTAMFVVKSKNIVLQDLVFIDTHPKNNLTYGGSTNGVAIRAQGATNTTVKDCSFTDFDQAIRVQASNAALIENNKFNGGYTTALINDPTMNAETGSKAVSVGGSSNLIIRNNIFDGPMLDGLSLFGGSGGNNLIEGNTFIDNAYAIYFGGASTKGSVLFNNTFINCGSFNRDGKNFTALPIISIQKSSEGITIKNNTFNVIDDNIIIAGEAGNEAHGAPTKMGNVNITGNIITPLDSAVDVSSVTLLNVLVRDGDSFEMDEAIIVKDNTFPNGVKGISVNFDGHEIFTADESVINQTLYPATLYDTSIQVEDVTVTAGQSVDLKMTLKDSNNNTLRGKTLMIVIDGKMVSVSTDSNGVATYSFVENAAGTKYVTISYLGEGSIYKASVATAKVTVNAKPAPPVVKKATTLTAKKATLKVKKAKKIKVTLKSQGKAVSGKTVTIKVNKKTFKAKTNSKGVATIKVKVTKKGKFNAVVKFAGDSAYKAASKTVRFTVKK